MSDRVCPYCEAQLGPRAVDMRPNQYLSAFMPRANKSAIVVLVVNVVFFLAQTFVRGVEDAGKEYTSAVFDHHQWWRLITAGFLHYGILHLAMNSWSLWILVTETEHFYGTGRLAVAYVFSTITGFALAAWLSPHATVVGASCAAFGLIGTMLAIGLRHRADPLAQAVRSQYGTWLVYGIAMSFIGRISLSGHVGGFLGGLAVGLIAGLPGLPGSPRETFWKIGGIAAVALVVLAWFEALTHLQYVQ